MAQAVPRRSRPEEYEMRKSELLVLIQSLQAEVSVLQKRVWDLEHQKDPKFEVGKIPVHRPATSPPTQGWVCPSTPNGA